MKISKEETFRPVTITLETETELLALKNIVKYLESLDGHSSSMGYRRCTYRFNSLSDAGRKMYYSLKSGL
ncbi:MAG: hypothetical protein V3S69_00250 [Dehalococcoidales bacterium]